MDVEMKNPCEAFTCNLQSLKDDNPDKWLGSLCQVRNTIMCNEYNIRKLVNSEMIISITICYRLLSTHTSLNMALSNLYRVGNNNRIFEIFNFTDTSPQIKACICSIFTVIFKSNFNLLSENAKKFLSENFMATVSSYLLIENEKLIVSILYLINAVISINELNWKVYFYDNKEILTRLINLISIKRFKKDCFIIPMVCDTLSTMFHDEEMVQNFITTDVWDDAILLQIFEHTLSDKINHQISSLNLMSILAQEHKHVVFMMMKIIVAERYITEILIYNIREHVDMTVQVRSCNILANFYMADSNKTLLNLTISYTLPTLCRLCNVKYDVVVRILAGSILHTLLKSHQELCMHAYPIEDIIQTLSQTISTSTPINKPDNLFMTYGYSDLLIQNAYKLFSVLTESIESIRNTVISFKKETPSLSRPILKHLKCENLGTRMACTYFLISISRSPKLLRKFFIDNEYAICLIENMKPTYPYNLRKFSLCCLCNLVLHLSHLRRKLLDPNMKFVESITVILMDKQEKSNIRFYATWILMNIMHTANETFKINFVKDIGLQFFLDIISGDHNAMIQEKTIGLLRNLYAACGEDWKLQEFQNYSGEFLKAIVRYLKFSDSNESLHTQMLCFLANFCSIPPCQQMIFENSAILNIIEMNLKNLKYMNISIACVHNLAINCSIYEIDILETHNIVDTMKNMRQKDLDGATKNRIEDTLSILI
ncbi:Armadillo repeat-containing protein 8 [Intoshia linei]|uniref:Armadillo repeat-containing protein 8 n=1 Tax=Intoshia linei TaxID=1819745 RepID=A0A177BBH4_9BILA|nr:Armadillo repeat-containing protein 8 [Intoshia linei]